MENNQEKDEIGSRVEHPPMSKRPCSGPISYLAQTFRTRLIVGMLLAAPMASGCDSTGTAILEAVASTQEAQVAFLANELKGLLEEWKDDYASLQLLDKSYIKNSPAAAVEIVESAEDQLITIIECLRLIRLTHIRANPAIFNDAMSKIDAGLVRLRQEDIQMLHRFVKEGGRNKIVGFIGSWVGGMPYEDAKLFDSALVKLERRIHQLRRSLLSLTDFDLPVLTSNGTFNFAIQYQQPALQPEPPVSLVPGRKPSEGRETKALQRLLIRFGFLPDGSDSGHFDQATKKALNFFRKRTGIHSKSGGEIIDLEILQAIQRFKPNPPYECFDIPFGLELGDIGSDVKIVQQKLIGKGFLPQGHDDGDFGGETRAALIKFQLSELYCREDEPCKGKVEVFTCWGLQR